MADENDTGSTRAGRLKRMSAGVAAALITAALAAAGTVPAHDLIIDQAPVATATPSELAAKEMPSGPKIAVDGIFRQETKAAVPAVPR